MIPREALVPTAREVLERYPIDPAAMIAPGVPVTRDWLAHCFQLFIDVEEEPLASEDQADPMASKIFGRPFLPAEVAWPERYYFYAQFNMREVAPHDPFGVVPARGMLYLFFAPDANDLRPSSRTAAKAIFVDEDRAGRALRPVPARATLPLGGAHYYDAFVARSARLTFAPAFWFSQPDTIPAGLIAALTERLGIRCVDSSSNMFGEPITWQGEDGAAGLFAPPDWDWRAGPPPTDPQRVLLFQRDFFDGHVHVWAGRDRIGQGDFSALEVTASVT